MLRVNREYFLRSHSLNYFTGRQLLKKNKVKKDEKKELLTKLEVRERRLETQVQTYLRRDPTKVCRAFLLRHCFTVTYFSVTSCLDAQLLNVHVVRPFWSD